MKLIFFEKYEMDSDRIVIFGSDIIIKPDVIYIQRKRRDKKEKYTYYYTDLQINAAYEKISMSEKYKVAHVKVPVLEDVRITKLG